MSERSERELAMSERSERELTLSERSERELTLSDARLRVPDDLLTDEAWQQLEHVYDPELGINLVDLGLVYRLDVKDGEVDVVMTLTTPGCPMSDSMPEAVERAMRMLPGVSDVSVDLVWEPRWEPEMMTERAKRELGWI